MHVEVDSDVCQGHGRCYELCPDVFRPDELGFSVVVKGADIDGQADLVRRAAINCPERAVTIAED